MAFEENEPRDIFYRAATELVALALQGSTTVSVAEALAVLLQTWNRAFYQYRGFSAEHLQDIEMLVRDHGPLLAPLRDRRIAELDPGQETMVKGVFGAFEMVLGPVGAAKSLYLLAPRFFPLWDRAIAAAYGLALGTTGTNATRYWSFMLASRDQCEALRDQIAPDINPLKAVDEYNYCHFTKMWT